MILHKTTSLSKIFQINSNVTDAYFGIELANYQDLFKSTVYVESIRDFMRILQRLDQSSQPFGKKYDFIWASLKLKLWFLFRLMNEENKTEKLYQIYEQVSNDLMIRNKVFYQGVEEYQLFSILFSYLSSKQTLQPVFQAEDIKHRCLHVHVRITLGNILLNKDQSRLLKLKHYENVLLKISHLFEQQMNLKKDLTNDAVNIFQEDLDFTLIFWFKLIEGNKQINNLSGAANIVNNMNKFCKQAKQYLNNPKFFMKWEFKLDGEMKKLKDLTTNQIKSEIQNNSTLDIRKRVQTQPSLVIDARQIVHTQIDNKLIDKKKPDTLQIQENSTIDKPPLQYHFGKAYSQKVRKPDLSIVTDSQQLNTYKNKIKNVFDISQTSLNSRQLTKKATTGATIIKTDTTFDKVDQLQYYFGKQNLITMQQLENYQLNKIARSGIYKQERKQTINFFTQNSEEQISCSKKKDYVQQQSPPKKFAIRPNFIEYLNSDLSLSKESILEDNCSKGSSVHSVIVLTKKNRNLRNIINSRFSQIMDLAQSEEKNGDLLHSPKFNAHERIKLFQNSLTHYQKARSNSSENNSQAKSEVITNTMLMRKRDSADRGQIARRIGVRIQQGDAMVKAFSQVNIAFQNSQSPEDLQMLQTSYLEATEEIKCCSLSLQAATIKLPQSNIQSQQAQTIKTMWVPSFQINFMYKSMLNFWQVKLVSPLASNWIKVYMFDHTNYQYIYQFCLPEFSRNQILKSNQTMWPEITNILLQKVQDLGCQQITSVLEKQIHSVSKTRKQGKFDEMQNLKNLLQILTQNLVYQQKKMTGRELQFLPSKYNEIDCELNYYEFMESSKLLYQKLNQYEKIFKRNSAVQLNIDNDQILKKKKKELINSNSRLLQQIIQFRFDSQDDQKYLLQVEPIQLDSLLQDADFLDGIKQLYGQFALIKVSIRVLREINQELEFLNDTFEFVFQIIFLPKSRITNPNKVKTKQQAFVTGTLGKRFPSLQIAPVCLKLGAIIKIMEDQQNQFGLLNVHLKQINFNKIIFDIINEKRQSFPFFYVLREFINKKMCINFEKQELAVKMNIFSSEDAIKLEAAGLALGFLVHKKPSQTPYAITEIERYIEEDANKQAPTEMKLYSFNPESLFQRNFQDINDQDYKQKRENQQVHRSLYDIVKEYQTKYHAQDPSQSHKVVVKKNSKQFGNLKIQVLTDFPYDPNQSQEKNHSKIGQINAGYQIKLLKQYDRIIINNNNIRLSIKLGEVIGIKLYTPFKSQLVVCNIHQNDKDYDDLLIKIRQFVGQGNHQIMKFAQQFIIKQVIQKMYQKYGGFDAFKQIIQNNSRMLNQTSLQYSIQEIPPYNMLKKYMLNQFDRLNSLFKYKNLLLVHKLKKYGIFQVNVHLFYSLGRELNQAFDNSYKMMEQEKLYLTDGNYFLMRLDIQSFNDKVGKTKLILNHFDIEKYLGIQIHQKKVDFRMTQNLLKLVTEQNAKFFTNQTIEAVAQNILQLLVLGRFRLTLTPYFSEVQLLFQQSYQKFQQKDDLSGSSQSELDSGERKRYKSINAEGINQVQGQRINNQVAQLRRINNKTQDSDFQLNKDLINKNFLEHFIKNSRLILNQVKKIHSVYHRHTLAIINLSLQRISTNNNDHIIVGEFATFSVYKNLLTNSWFLIIYIPRTSRRLVAMLSQTDISETSGNKVPVFQPIQYKDSIRDNPNIKMTYKELDKLCERTKISAMSQLRANSFNMKDKNQNIPKSVKSDSGSLFRKSEKRVTLNEELIKKQGLNLSNMISEFFILTDIVSNCLEFTVHTFIRGEDQSLKLFQLLEKKIWMNILNQLIGLKLNTRKDNEMKVGIPLSSELISLNLGSKVINMSEFLCSHYMRIERIGEAQVEFFIKYDYNIKQFTSSSSASLVLSPNHSLSIIQNFKSLKTESLTALEQPRRLAQVIEKLNTKQPLGLTGLILEAKEADEQTKFARKINVFQPFEAISYASSSNFNIELRYYSFNQLQEATQSINLRELLNLYIADGYYKYQTTYMNSKLNLSDIHNICSYMIYKIKTQNFLNLTQYHVKEKPFQKKVDVPTSISDDTLISVSSGEMPRLRTFYYKPNKQLITIRLFYTGSYVEFQLMNLENKKITKQKLSFDQIDQIIIFFEIVVLEDQIMALDRLQKGIRLILRLFSPKIKITE